MINIKVPKWFYVSLPYVSYLVGMLGVATCGRTDKYMLLVSVALSAYGLAIILIRDIKSDLDRLG